MFVRPWLRFGALSCVFQALAVFSRPPLCLSDLSCFSEILVVFSEALVVLFRPELCFIRPWLRFGDLSCVF